MLNWKPLENREQLEDIVSRSTHVPQLIFKHSTRCSISAIAKNRLERQEVPSNVEFHFLDLLRFRTLSDEVAKIFNVRHESPQVILVKNGVSTFDASHTGVEMTSISSAL